MNNTTSQSVVITGGTRGIGFGMAREFLVRGHNVTICGRSTDSTQAAVDALAEIFGHDHVNGVATDVSHYDDIQHLWDAAVERFSKVDIWINNAGLSHPMVMIWELPTETHQQIIQTNIVGVLNGAKVAMNGMIAQGSGQIYNMEGHGSNGSVIKGLSVYGATKYSVAYLNKALKKEAEDTPVQVCALSPGIVATDLLFEGYVDQADFERSKRILNILGDKVETVTPYLVENILNNRDGKDVRWLTTPKIVWRFISAPFSDRDIFEDVTPSTLNAHPN